MTRCFIPATLAVIALTFGANYAVADDADGMHTAKTKPARKVANVKLVDINSAKAQELKKLPGIGDAEAEKIIAGRPYGSKAWLISHNILPADKYPAIQNLIIAKQPSNDAATNAAIYSKKK